MHFVGCSDLMNPENRKKPDTKLEEKKKGFEPMRKRHAKLSVALWKEPLRY